MKTKTKSNPTYKRSLPIILVALIAIYFLLPQLASFRTSLQTIADADSTYIFYATAFFIGTYFAAASVYYFIAYIRLRYWPTLLIQVADGFTNRLAPAGIGAVATNVLYLIKQSKSGVQAGYVAGLNNLIGFVAHMLLLIALLIVSQQSPHHLFKYNWPHLSLWLCLALVIIIGSLAFFWQRLKKVSTQGFNYLAKVIAASLKHPIRLLIGLLMAMLITILYGLCLFSVMLALNVHLTILQTFIALTISVIAVTVTPTPGGLIGVEAGLVAALVSFGVAAGPALSVVLVYRFITYWLPILPGAAALEFAIRRSYIGRN